MANAKDLLKGCVANDGLKNTEGKAKESSNNILGNEDKPLSSVDGNISEQPVEVIRQWEDDERKRREAEDPKIAEEQASIAHGLASMIQDRVLHGQIPKARSVDGDLVEAHYDENRAVYEKSCTKEFDQKGASKVANLILKAPHLSSKDETSDPLS